MQNIKAWKVKAQSRPQLNPRKSDLRVCGVAGLKPNPRSICINSRRGFTVATEDNLLVLWDYKLNRQLVLSATRNHHKSVITSTACDPSGLYLASADVDRAVVVWDVSGTSVGGLYHDILRLERHVPGHLEQARHVELAFSPNGAHLAVLDVTADCELRLSVWAWSAGFEPLAHEVLLGKEPLTDPGVLRMQFLAGPDRVLIQIDAVLLRVDLVAGPRAFVHHYAPSELRAAGRWVQRGPSSAPLGASLALAHSAAAWSDTCQERVQEWLARAPEHRSRPEAPSAVWASPTGTLLLGTSAGRVFAGALDGEPHPVLDLHEARDRLALVIGEDLAVRAIACDDSGVVLLVTGSGAQVVAEAASGKIINYIAVDGSRTCRMHRFTSAREFVSVSPRGEVAFHAVLRDPALPLRLSPCGPARSIAAVLRCQWPCSALGVQSLPPELHVSCLAASRGKMLLACGIRPGIVWVASSAPGVRHLDRKPTLIDAAEPLDVSSTPELVEIDLSPDGEHLACGFRSGAVVLCRVDQGGPPALLTGPAAPLAAGPKFVSPTPARAQPWDIKTPAHTSLAFLSAPDVVSVIGVGHAGRPTDAEGTGQRADCVLDAPCLAFCVHPRGERLFALSAVGTFLSFDLSQTSAVQGPVRQKPTDGFVPVRDVVVLNRARWPQMKGTCECSAGDHVAVAVWSSSADRGWKLFMFSNQGGALVEVAHLNFSTSQPESLEWVPGEEVVVWVTTKNGLRFQVVVPGGRSAKKTAASQFHRKSVPPGMCKNQDELKF